MRTSSTLAGITPPHGLTRLLATTAILCVAACGGDAATAAHPEPAAEIRLASISEGLYTGDTRQLEATELDRLGQPLRVTEPIAWSLAEPTSAIALSPTGKVTALRPGSGIVSAATSALTARARIVVHDRTVATVDLFASRRWINTGELGRVVATPLDATGAPVPHAAVSWSISDTSLAVIDDSGLVTALDPGQVLVTATSQGHSGSILLHLVVPELELGVIYPLVFKTYDGSRQVVHPDIVYFPRSWHGRRYWAAITPYPNGDASFENPSIFSSPDGEDWHPPAGLVNPVARPGHGYLSDPDLLYDSLTDELRLYFRNTTANDSIYLTRSSDGSSWSRPVGVFGGPGTSHISPSFVRTPDGRWRAWYVDAADGCRATSALLRSRSSSDGVNWGPSSPAFIDQPGRVIWHLDIQYIASRAQYVMIFAAYPAGATCGSSELYLATSSDGERWTTYSSPLLPRNFVPRLRDNVYRSSFIFDPVNEIFTIWYSGSRYEDDGSPRWRAAIGRITLGDAMARVTTYTGAAPILRPAAAARWSLANVAP